MNALIGDTKRQSRYPRAQRADPALIPRTHATHLQLLIHIAEPASTPYSPHTDRRPCTHPSPCTHHHTPRTPHIHLTRPAPTLQTPRSPCIHPTHLVDSGSTTYLAHRADPTSISHTHTHQTLLSPRIHPALNPRAPQTPRPPRPLTAEPQPLPAESESAPPGGAGGKRRLRCASPTRDSAGGSSSSRGRGRELLATLRGPRSPSPPAQSLSPVPRVAGDPETPARGHAAGLARCLPPPFSPLTARRHLPPTQLSIGNSQLSPGRRHRLRRGRRRRSEELRRPPLNPRRGGRRDL